MIENDEIDGGVSKRTAHASTVWRGADAIAVIAEITLHQLPNFGMVVDDKKVGPRLHGVQCKVWRGRPKRIFVTDCVEPALCHKALQNTCR